LTAVTSAAGNPSPKARLGVDLQVDSKLYAADVKALRISEVAERTGFSPATLRYYESIGLVTAPARSDGGYRVYDERALARLEFVARAKKLGLSLDEVRELARSWDDDECASVQRSMAAFVTAKLDTTDARIAELSAFGEQLRAVLAGLAERPKSGPCDADCACHRAGTEPELLTVLSHPPISPLEDVVRARADCASVSAGPAVPGDPEHAGFDVPIRCALPSGQLSERMAEWHDVVAQASARQSLPDGVRVPGLARPGRAADPARYRRAGLLWVLHLHRAGRTGRVALDVTAPAEAAPLVDELFGAAR